MTAQPLKQGKFEIRLPTTQKNRAFAEKCRVAFYDGESTVKRNGKEHRVYYFAATAPQDREQEEYIIGLVRTE